jgi:hypothetical protein
MLKVVTFREMAGSAGNVPSIQALRSEVPQSDEANIVSYLRSGIVLEECLGVDTDVLDTTDQTLLYQSELTDGVWAWREDLPHYVGKYHVRLPSEFVAHMRANQWIVPPKESIDPSVFE